MRVAGCSDSRLLLLVSIVVANVTYYRLAYCAVGHHYTSATGPTINGHPGQATTDTYCASVAVDSIAARPSGSRY